MMFMQKKDKAEKDLRFVDKRKYGIFHMFIRLFIKTFKHSPFVLSIFFVLSIAHGLSWGVIVIFQQRFYDSVILLASGDLTIKATIYALILYAICKVISQLLNAFCNFYFSYFDDKANGINQRELNIKTARLSPIMFEDTQVLDDMQKASQGMYASVMFVLMVSLTFAFYLPYFLIMGWYLFNLQPILVLSLLFVFIPVMFSHFMKVKVFTKFEDKAAPKRREMNYYQNCCHSRELYKETRLLGVFGFFNKLYKECLEIVQKLSWRAQVRTTLMELGMKVISLAGYMGIFYMAFRLTMSGKISIGAFVTVVNSISMLFGIMEELLVWHFGRISKDIGMVRNYIRFLEFKEHGGDDCDIEQDFDITVKNVSFCYPVGKVEKEKNKEKEENKEKVYALKDVSLTIKNGETIAIVGENGSGKSTLVRLITGMYQPEVGDVYIGKTNTKNASLNSLFSKSSGVFQKYQRYQMLLKDNISISQTEKKVEEDELISVCDMSGVEYNSRSYPKGFDTMLSREFDGVDLSGGQWQRVAIARGYYRDHELIVLDEPTAAIDPLEEKNIYDRFATISKEKTAVIVTHRLGSVKLADRIVMMEKGKILGCGSHEELYAACPQYAVLWDSQSDLYK